MKRWLVFYCDELNTFEIFWGSTYWLQDGCTARGHSWEYVGVL